MNEQRHVETLEDFKLRIGAIISGKPEQTKGAPRPDPRLGATQQTRESPEDKTLTDPLILGTIRGLTTAKQPLKHFAMKMKIFQGRNLAGLEKEINRRHWHHGQPLIIYVVNYIDRVNACRRKVLRGASPRQCRI